MNEKITPCLWFDNQAKEAGAQKFMFMESAHPHALTFSEGVSLTIHCDAGRNRLLLGKAERRRTGKHVWLAERPIRRMVAGHSDRIDQYHERSRQGR